MEPSFIPAKGYAAFSASTPLAPYAFQRRVPRDHDVVIQIKFSGICHSDIHTVRSEWGEANYPVVPGHEIAGIVQAVGPKVTRYKVGDTVGVGCFVDSCRECSSCKSDLNNYCLNGFTGTYNSLERDGKTPTQGGYSDVIVVDQNYVLRIPPSLPLDKAAPLLCAGITLYSPLKHWGAGPGKTVGIIGLGGLGHMGVKIAKAMGARVVVFSHSAKKQKDALEMGADHFIDTSVKDALVPWQGQMDLIVNTVSAEINMNDYFECLKLDATLVAVGLPEKPLTFHPFPLVLMRRRFAGSVIGSIQETQEMLDFCAAHAITPEIELIAPREVNVAYDRVLKSDVRYRFVMDMGRL